MSEPRLTATASAFGPFPDNLAKTDSLQTISGADWLPLISSADGGAVLAKLKDYPVYVLADPDLMNTHGLNDRADRGARDVDDRKPARAEARRCIST